MKFSKKNLPKSRTDLERFVSQHGLRAQQAVDYKGRKIFLAETELETDRPKEYDWGYYQTAWFLDSMIAEEGFQVGHWIEFDAMHDTDEGWTPRTKRMARVNATIAEAQDFIDKMSESDA